MERGRRFQDWQHDEVVQEDGGHAFIEVHPNGEVEVHAGYRDRDERGDGSAEGGEATVKPDGATIAKPELTKAAENYLALHRHAIVRAELLSRPGLALRLTVAHIIAGSPLWSVRPEPQRADKDAIAQSVAAGRAQAAFETERAAILELIELESSPFGTLTRGNGDAYRGAAVLARLLTLPDEQVLRVLTLLMAETLCAGSALVEVAGFLVTPDVARWWEADDTFLDLVRDRVAVNAMLAVVAGADTAAANVSEATKVQRKIIRDCLNGEGRDKTEGWVPRYMAFPSQAYDVTKTLQAASDWEAVKDLFTGA
jgi:ParB family chromosome partitioning protein